MNWKRHVLNSLFLSLSFVAVVAPASADSIQVTAPFTSLVVGCNQAGAGCSSSFLTAGASTIARLNSSNIPVNTISLVGETVTLQSGLLLQSVNPLPYGPESAAQVAAHPCLVGSASVPSACDVFGALGPSTVTFGTPFGINFQGQIATAKLSPTLFLALFPHGFKNQFSGTFSYVPFSYNSATVINLIPTATPEPGTMTLLGSGLLAIAAAFRRRSCA